MKILSARAEKPGHMILEVEVSRDEYYRTFDIVANIEYALDKTAKAPVDSSPPAKSTAKPRRFFELVTEADGSAYEIPDYEG